MSTIVDMARLRREVRKQSELVDRLSGAQDDEGIRGRGVALLDLGRAQFKLGKYDVSVSSFEEAATILGRFPDRPAQVVVARAMQIRALTKLGRQKALLESVQKLLDLNMSLPGQPDLRAGMLALKVVLLKSLGRHDKEIFAAAWALMTEIEPGKTPNQRRAVARAMVTIGRIKLSLGQPEQALIALQGAVGRSDDDVNDDESRDVLAEAYVGIGMVLEQQGRIEDALAAYDQALSIPAPSDYASTDTYAEAARRKAELTARASTGGDEGKSP